MTEPDPPELTTSQNGVQHPAASVDSIVTLIHSFSAMVQSVKADLLREMTTNASASRERWDRWERDFAKYQRDTDRRIELVEEQGKILHTRIDKIEKEDERDHLVWDARLGPLRNALALMSRNWKSLLVIFFAILGALGLANTVIEDGLHMLGLP